MPPPKGDVTVELSGVTLGDDCGASWTPPPPVNRPASPAKAAAASESMQDPAAAPARRPPGTAPAQYAPSYCQQTSIQLALHATGTSAPTPIKIKKVELLDANGKFVVELTASGPTRWSDAGSYQTWDQTVAPNEEAAVSYVLSSPAWHSMEGGQYAQTGKTFQVRVTVLVGAKDRVVEKKAIQPAMMPPPVPT